MRLCTIIELDGSPCPLPLYCKGMCTKHYERNRRYGDPLGALSRRPPGTGLNYWLEHVLDPGQPDPDGWGGIACRDWEFDHFPNGYGRIQREHVAYGVHVITTEVWLGPRPDGLDASHLCGRGTDGCWTGEHLIWETPGENNRRKEEHGTLVAGEHQHLAKLNSRRARLAYRSYHDDGVPIAVLAKRYEVHPATIWSLVMGKTWKREIARRRVIKRR